MLVESLFGDTFGDFFTIDTNNTPGNHMLTLKTTADGLSIGGAQTKTLTINLDYKLDQMESLDFSSVRRTFTLQILDCTQVITQPSTKLTVLTVVDGLGLDLLDSRRVNKVSDSEFTFVIDSGDGFEIQIEPSTNSLHADTLCGVPSYTVTGIDSDYLSFDSASSKLFVNTIGLDETAIPLEIRV